MVPQGDRECLLQRGPEARILAVRGDLREPGPGGRLREEDAERTGAEYGGELLPQVPAPELTYGLPAHTDPNTLTVLLMDQQVAGLQVLKDGRWIAVNPRPDALVIIIGEQLLPVMHYYCLKLLSKPSGSILLFWHSSTFQVTEQSSPRARRH